MKKSFKKIISVLLSIALVFSIGCIGVNADEKEPATNNIPSTEIIAGEITDSAIAGVQTIGGLFAGLQKLDS